MKKYGSNLFFFAGALILIAKIANIIFGFSDQINSYINYFMFTIIGLYYIFGFTSPNKSIKFIVFFCGIYLILMNFIPKSTMVEIFGIICIVAPMLIRRFSPEMRKIAPEDAE
ncbi:hypothetical protein SAMN05421638_0011 [Kaistella treverensis]|uniref:Uncharacterized protein n=1 Tax=Kaistella treverensis TaxID=631455 RepID=A0A1I3J7Z0_9FLAO|nr:hypothetical protein [Kaistella treverensis]SFI56382.1 hypothetical protein SAMN05421638_0011 [Kaistella treverensis]